MATDAQLTGDGPSIGGDAPDLTACDREPIHIPGSVQPHGLLLIADAASGRIIAGAGAIESRLAQDWLGRPIEALIGVERPAAGVTLVQGIGETFEATTNCIDDHVVVELEPASPATATGAHLLRQLDGIAATFERAADLHALCERAAAAFRELTGFDRVMIYRFLDDGAGRVIAEDRDPALHSFLNHHFPAADIPRQARALYVRNRVRVIPDVHYTPAPLRPADGAFGAIDLSDVALRSVSPIHLQYLRNMGVAASASISIVKDGLLWGLVACHHQGPRTIDLAARTACAALAGGLARQIRAKEEAETYRERVRLRAAEDSILARFAGDTPLFDLLGGIGEELRRMLGADGFAAVRGREVSSTGIVPPAGELRDLARAIAPKATAEPFATHMLGARVPAATAYAETASGLLATAIGDEASTLLMWFRAEEPETVNWAGNPHKAVAHDPDAILTPRTSFEAWREELRGRSRRWTLGEIEAAARLRRALFDLRQAARLRDLNRELSATIADREALIQQKDYLLGEVNHRIQNSLQLVQSFLALQAREAPEIADQLGEAQRRLSAVALVHRRLYQGDQLDTVDLSRYLDELAGDMRTALGAEWGAALSLDLAPVLVPADRAVSVGLVMTELVINANKYAYGGRPGPVAIALEEYRNQFRLIVADHGSGQAAGAGHGFGTRMMNALIDRLDGSIERFDNHPGLRVIVTAPIQAD